MSKSDSYRAGLLDDIRQFAFIRFAGRHFQIGVPGGGFYNKIIKPLSGCGEEACRLEAHLDGIADQYRQGPVSEIFSIGHLFLQCDLEQMNFKDK